MELIYDQKQRPIEEAWMRQMERGAVLCVEEEGIPTERVEISLSFVSPEEIRMLNRDYRGIDRVTDVLSFYQYDDLNEIDPEDTGEIILGDVVICWEQAQTQAEEFGHSLQRELVYLFVHSVCHLLGYDHMEETDKAEMRQKEERIMAALRLSRA